MAYMGERQASGCSRSRSAAVNQMAIQEVGRRDSGNNDQEPLPNPTQPLSKELPSYIAPLPSELAVSVSADQANRKKWQSGSQGDERPSTSCRRPAKRSCREAYVMGQEVDLALSLLGLINCQ